MSYVCDSIGAGRSLSHLFLRPPPLTWGSQAQGECDLPKAPQRVGGGAGPAPCALPPGLPWRVHCGVCSRLGSLCTIPVPTGTWSMHWDTSGRGQKAVCTMEPRHQAGEGDPGLHSWEPGLWHHRVPLRVGVGDSPRGIFSCGHFFPSHILRSCI